MLLSRETTLIRWANQFDLNLCLLFNSLVRKKQIQRLFVTISRLGNGVFWYSLMIALPLLYGLEGLVSAIHMAGVGVAGVLIYKTIKNSFVRDRPFVSHTEIQMGTQPLDQYSFPSGHTLHAFAFSIVAISYYPLLAFILIPFSLLVAASRMILGLHYPSDVLMGAAIGTLLAQSSLFLMG